MPSRLAGRVICVVAFGALVCAASPGLSAAGSAPSPYARAGFYAGLGAVYALEDFDYDSERLGIAAYLGPNVDPHYDDSAGVDVVLGYRAHPHLGFEVVYQFLEGFDSTDAYPRTELDTHSLTFNARFHPLKERLQPYIALGVGVLYVNTEIRGLRVRKPFDADAAFSVRAGGGLDLYLTEHLMFEVEGVYLDPIGGLAGGADQGSLAAKWLYRF